MLKNDENGFELLNFRNLPFKPTQSSLKFCSEKFCCNIAIAKFICQNCKSFQCEHCCLELHRLPHFQGHLRSELSVKELSNLCSSSICLNLEDVFCFTCLKSFCVQCDFKIHHKKNTFHKKVFIEKSLSKQKSNFYEQLGRKNKISEFTLCHQSAVNSNLEVLKFNKENNFIIKNSNKIKKTTIYNNHIQKNTCEGDLANYTNPKLSPNPSSTSTIINKKNIDSFHKLNDQTDLFNQINFVLKTIISFLLSKKSLETMKSTSQDFNPEFSFSNKGSLKNIKKEEDLTKVLRKDGEIVEMENDDYYYHNYDNIDDSINNNSGENNQNFHQTRNDVKLHSNNKQHKKNNSENNEEIKNIEESEEEKEEEEDEDEKLINGLMTSSVLNEMKPTSFPLMDQQENLLLDDEEQFLKEMNCDKDSLIKVVSIFGNTGDGKSHTLNHTFFSGQPVFRTSAHHSSCTIGCWGAHDMLHHCLVLDTEGLLGASPNHNHRTRMLLKILAISDIIIYRTRAERLHSDMFHFLGEASKAYMKHFVTQLTKTTKKLKLDSLSSIGPALVIFHETLYTDTLQKGAKEPAEFIIREKFKEMNLDCSSFSSIIYVGTKRSARNNKQLNNKNEINTNTNYGILLEAVKQQLSNNDIRCPRKPHVVFKVFKALNDRFSGSLPSDSFSMFPDQYFSCRTYCLACNNKCCQTMNHELDNLGHQIDPELPCKHNSQYNNTFYICKSCYKRGLTVEVQPKVSSSTEGALSGLANYAWSGYVLECGNCGVIYRSRQHWYGNQEPEKTAVRTEIRHVWPGDNQSNQPNNNTARRLVDSINFFSETIADVGAVPAKMISDWFNDQIAPSYWEPNYLVKNCRKCGVCLDVETRVHHCRCCGRGFCEDCSSKRRQVVERGWGSNLVRVCDECFHFQCREGVCREDKGNSSISSVYPSNSSQKLKEDYECSQVVPRKVGEALGSTVNILSNIAHYPLTVLKDATMPDYWVADHLIIQCFLCKRPFNKNNNINTINTTNNNNHYHDTLVNFNNNNTSNNITNNNYEAHNQDKQNYPTNKNIKNREYNNNKYDFIGNIENNQTDVEVGIEGSKQNINKRLTKQFSDKITNNCNNNINNDNSNNIITNNNNDNKNENKNKYKNSNNKSKPFLKIHHCRACGQGVCGDCSNHQMPVSGRGWHYPVRVCEACFKKSDFT